jgi:hypothetical protein
MDTTLERRVSFSRQSPVTKIMQNNHWLGILKKKKKKKIPESQSRDRPAFLLCFSSVATRRPRVHHAGMWIEV